MKRKTATICKMATTFITAVALASIAQVGISSAGDNGKKMTNGTIRVQQEEASYPGLATITIEQAKDVALSNVQGEVLKIELEDENGFLVYGVEIVTPEKIIADVKVDAGNGEILRVDKDAADDGGDGYNEGNKNDDRHEGDHEENGREDKD